MCAVLVSISIDKVVFNFDKFSKKHASRDIYMHGLSCMNIHRIETRCPIIAHQAGGSSINMCTSFHLAQINLNIYTSTSSRKNLLHDIWPIEIYIYIMYEHSLGFKARCPTLAQTRGSSN
jgi:hypothetical protein